jgi:hypothetical protein
VFLGFMCGGGKCRSGYKALRVMRVMRVMKK